MKHKGPNVAKKKANQLNSTHFKLFYFQIGDKQNIAHKSLKRDF